MLKRLIALVKKEWILTMRDVSSLNVAIVIPLMFVLIFGFGITMDIRNIKLAIVAPELDDTCARELIARFRDNQYFTVAVVDTQSEGADLLANRKVDVTLSLPPRLDRRAGFCEADFLISVNATQAAIARPYKDAVMNIVESVVASAGTDPAAVSFEPRFWYNPSALSRWFLIPGVIVVVMSLIGCMLTALQLAKEYETGTMESLFATPATPLEIILAKLVNNYFLGLAGLFLSLAICRWGFGVPIRGSFGWVFAGSSAFLFSQMALGLVFSSMTKNQFLAANLAGMFSFMPSTILSGFIYEIGNMPKVLQYITTIFPARYYVEFLQTAFLAGDIERIYLRNLVVLIAFTVGFVLIAIRLNRKQLQEGV